MSRTPHATDFFVEVDGIGRLGFARRKLIDQFKIRGLYSAATSGNFDAAGNMADLGALAYVTIQTLIVPSSGQFDIDLIDPLMDDNAEEEIMRIWIALREKERSFRPNKKTNSATTGEAGSGDT